MPFEPAMRVRLRHRVRTGIIQMKNSITEEGKKWETQKN